MKSSCNFSVTKLTSLFSLLEHHGISRESILEKTDLDVSLLEFPDNKIPLSELEKMIQLASSLTKDNHFGLHQGQYLGTGFSNIINYILMNCETLYEALKRYCKYEQIIDESTKTTFHNNPKDNYGGKGKIYTGIANVRNRFGNVVPMKLRVEVKNDGT